MKPERKLVFVEMYAFCWLVLLLPEGESDLHVYFAIWNFKGRGYSRLIELEKVWSAPKKSEVSNVENYWAPFL